MCEIYLKKKTDIREGYKILAYKDGKFYSTFTGQEIGIGKVPLPPEVALRISMGWTSSIETCGLFKNFDLYNPTTIGFSSIFLNYGDAVELYINLLDDDIILGFSLVLVKIKFSDNSKIYRGSFDYYTNIIMGNDIASIDILSQSRPNHTSINEFIEPIFDYNINEIDYSNYKKLNYEYL